MLPTTTPNNIHPPPLPPGKPLPKLEVDALRGLRGVKEAAVTLPADAPPGVAGRTLRVAVASGIGNARHLLAAMRAGEAPAYDFVEVRACACVGPSVGDGWGACVCMCGSVSG